MQTCHLPTDSRLQEIYGRDVAAQRKRYQEAAEHFYETFGGDMAAVSFFSAPGRTEIGGNHTDHNHGMVLAGGVNLDVIAVVRKTAGSRIVVQSQGYPCDNVDLSDLDIVEAEKNTSVALIRGICARFQQLGYQIGGFEAYTTSNVLKGSGLSSSAAFEVLVCTILSHLYNEGAVDAVQCAQISQYAENVYFGKPCGLMDQMASAVGGLVQIDFADPKKPDVRQIPYGFDGSGHTLCIVDTKADHADLTDEYAAIPAEMKAAAQVLGVSFLRETDKASVLAHAADIRAQAGDRALLRALHFCDENARVLREADALSQGDFDAFLQQVRMSGKSSYEYLQNVFAPHAAGREVCLALYLSEMVLDGTGACRVHGGGFAGTIQAFVPQDRLDAYVRTLEGVFGEGSCYCLRIREQGGIRV